jgi:hypothetical protein
VVLGKGFTIERRAETYGPNLVNYGKISHVKMNISLLGKLALRACNGQSCRDGALAACANNKALRVSHVTLPEKEERARMVRKMLVR